MKLPVLETVVKDEDISKLLLFCNEAGFISVGPNDDRNISETSFDEHGFVAALFPIRIGDDDPPACSPVTAREHYGSKASVPHGFCECNNQWSFAGSTDGKIPDADYG